MNSQPEERKKYVPLCVYLLLSLDMYIKIQIGQNMLKYATYKDDDENRVNVNTKTVLQDELTTDHLNDE